MREKADGCIVSFGGEISEVDALPNQQLSLPTNAAMGADNWTVKGFKLGRVQLQKGCLYTQTILVYINEKANKLRSDHIIKKQARASTRKRVQPHMGTNRPTDRGWSRLIIQPREIRSLMTVTNKPLEVASHSAN